MKAEELIKHLKLEPLPSEGGFYRQTFKSSLNVQINERGHVRSAGTAIYYLITPDDFSALHRVKHDEIFHFYLGDRVEMFQISTSGESIELKLGSNIAAGESPQVIVPQNYWQGCRLSQGGNWALLGCTVAPGFEFVDFELGSRSQLSKEFPKAGALIEKYTRSEE